MHARTQMHVYILGSQYVYVRVCGVHIHASLYINSTAVQLVSTGGTSEQTLRQLLHKFQHALHSILLIQCFNFVPL